MKNPNPKKKGKDFLLNILARQKDNEAMPMNDLVEYVQQFTKLFPTKESWVKQTLTNFFAGFQESLKEKEGSKTETGEDFDSGSYEFNPTKMMK